MEYSKIEGAIYRELKNGEHLIRIGEKAKYFYVVETGSCHRIKYMVSGEEIIMTVYSQNDIVCAFNAYYDMVSASEIVANGTCTCWQIPRDTFLKTMDNCPQLMKKFLEQILQEYFDMNMRLRSKHEGQTPNLLCHFLLSHARRNSNHQLVVDRAYSNVALAKHMGVHRVTITRIINVLKQEGVLERTKEGLVITDLELLNEYAVQERHMKY